MNPRHVPRATSKTARPRAEKPSVREAVRNETRATYREAIAMFQSQVGPDDPAPGGAMTGLAQLLSRAGRVAEAEQAYDQVIGLYQRIKSTNVNLPIAIFNRAELARKHERCADALPLYQQSAADFLRLKGEKSPYLIYPLVGEASCLVTVGRGREATPLLDRAGGLRGGDALRDAMVGAWRGRALVETGGDRKRGLALARTARGELAAITNDVEAPDELRELDRWLAAHPR